MQRGAVAGASAPVQLAQPTGRQSTQVRATLLVGGVAVAVTLSSLDCMVQSMADSTM